MNTAAPLITVQGLTVGYGSYVVQRDLDFTINRQDVFIIMGPSGCGKSSLLRVLVGLLPPAAGQVLYDGTDFWAQNETQRQAMLRRVGLLFQSGALWSSMTLAENVGLPLQRYTKLSPAAIREQTSLKLSLVGLAGFEDFYPSEISGGMRKRAGLARALALDPEIVFFDEPSAGLDPVSAALLDELILELKENLKMTVVVVTHDLDSIFTIGNNSVFLDAATHTMLTGGDPHILRTDPAHPGRGSLPEAGGRRTRRRREPTRTHTMSKSANKTVIGAFVAGALALLFLAIAVFGSGRLFQSSTRYVLFFDSSIKGLSLGSPVMFRGVPVGRVVEIQLTGNLRDMVFQTPVFIELDQKSEKSIVGAEDSISDEQYLDRLIAHGLRASLANQSLLTGQLLVELNFYSPNELSSHIDRTRRYAGVLEIPTLPSKLDDIMQKAFKLPYEQITANILSITEELDKLLKSSDLLQIAHKTNTLLDQLDGLARDMNATLKDVRALITPYARLAATNGKTG